MIERWAFARINLHLSDEEFAATPRPKSPPSPRSGRTASNEFALATASALNSKWSHADKALPFSPRDFLPKTPAQVKAEEKARAAAQEMRDGILEIQFAAFAKQKKGGPSNGQAEERPSRAG
ncbi:MAG: hypothetical protein IPL39_16280 [Opitutaceae bacterium]|nr:hypothetical protein [Opitutaceae bacterium]